MSEISAPNIPGYRTGVLLAKGGMGAVYRAERISDGLQVAIKVMLNPSDERCETRARRFLREARATASLDHPNIIRVYDSGEADGQLYMIMDYIEGPLLRDLMAAGMAHRDIHHLIEGLCEALQTAHDAGFVHRDIKPDNVLISKAGNAILTDFGVVKLLDPEKTRLTRTGITLGSVHFMAPEQCVARNIDHRSDLYAIGVLLFQMLEGRPPFDGINPIQIATQHLSGPMPELSEENAAYQGIIDRLLAKQQVDRYQSAREVIDALAAVELG